MKAIIIGAGRGRRLMPLTEETPKCFAEVGGKRILDWALEAFRAAGLREVVFIGGYQIEKVRAAYPHLTFCHNAAWEQNNILASLFCAEEHFSEGFVCSYADILYRPRIVESLMSSPHDITLAVDTAWRDRYRLRTQHPEDDAEKVVVEGDRLLSVSREVSPERAHGEYIGVARFTPRGAGVLREHHRRVQRDYDGQPFQGAPSVQKAYFIHLIQNMIERGVTVHKVDTQGDYMEVDTTEDYLIAQQAWRSSYE
ncbi:MAG: phosphocholine cytidylyltransferase family protein [Candidatus Latescibacteria bacterium]|nr:phosphocholine cytidylyltransferase family protein [Candidatus Latescibacterota bacterium]